MFFDDDVVVVMLVGGEKRTEGGNWTNTQTEKENKNKIVKEVVAGEYANNVAGHTAQSRRRRKEKKEKKTHGVQRVSHFGLFVVYLNETTRSSRPDRKLRFCPFCFFFSFMQSCAWPFGLLLMPQNICGPGRTTTRQPCAFWGPRGYHQERNRHTNSLITSWVWAR